MIITLLILAAVCIAVLLRQLDATKKREGEMRAQILHLTQRMSQLKLSSSMADGRLLEAQRQGERATQRAKELEQQLREQAEGHAAQLDRRAERAVAASRGSFDGHIAEALFPAAPEHDYHPKDIFHFGGVVDYIVFDGLHDAKYNNGDPEAITIVFVEVKWGKGRLSGEQRSVLSSMNAGRTRFETWHAKQADADSLEYRKKLP